MADQSTTSGTVVLFDDERSFIPGFRDDAVVIRTLVEAEKYFAELRESGDRIAELWLDFVLSPGSTDQIFYAGFDFPGDLVDRVIYQSSAIGGFGLIKELLQESGFQGELEWPTDNFCGQTLFQPSR